MPFFVSLKSILGYNKAINIWGVQNKAMEINSLKQVKEIMDRFGIAPNKAFGQNFLLDKGILDKIANSAQLDKNTDVLEIGPGMGALTDRLCDRGKKVVCIEIDKGMLPILDYTLSDRDNAEIISGDVLDERVREEAVSKLDKPFNIVANLPYYITTPIIMTFLQGGYDLSSMTLMMQKEVAERICAKKGSKSYGILSVCMAYYADVEILFTIAPECFFPRPKVDSMLIRILKLNKPRISVKDEKLFFKVVRASFAMRRKTLINNLSVAFKLSKEELKSILIGCGIKENIRGECLSLEEYGKLADEIFNKTVE